MRETITLTLPESKAKVTLYAYLTGGDFRAVQNKLLSTTDITLEDAENLKSIPGSAIMDADDFMVKLLIKEITNEAGVVANLDEYVYNLSIADSNVLFDKARGISNASSLSPDAKKKS